MSGFFFTFEGIDKSGKTTQAKVLADRLKEMSREVVLTLEPGGTDLGREIRSLVVEGKTGENISDRAEVLLFAADRAQHVWEVIRPALEAGKIVISDRYTDSTLAYQGYGRGLNLDWLAALQEKATGGLRPHRTFLVDVDLETSRARGGLRGADRLETGSEALYKRIRNGYFVLAQQEPDRLIRVDGTLPIEGLSDQIYGLVAEVIEGLGTNPI